MSFPRMIFTRPRTQQEGQVQFGREMIFLSTQKPSEQFLDEALV